MMVQQEEKLQEQQANLKVENQTYQREIKVWSTPFTLGKKVIIDFTEVVINFSFMMTVHRFKFKFSTSTLKRFNLKDD